MAMTGTRTKSSPRALRIRRSRFIKSLALDLGELPVLTLTFALVGLGHEGGV